MSYNTNNAGYPYPSNNAVNSYPPPPPPGHPGHNAYSQQQNYQQQQQDEYNYGKSNDPQDDNQHMLTGFLGLRIFRILTRLIDQGSPLLIYSLMRIWATNVVALAIATAPPILRLAYFLIVYKKVDPCGLLYLSAFIIALCLSPIPASARNSFIRDSSITLIMGSMFIFSLIPFQIGWYRNRPLIFLNSKKTFEPSTYITWTIPSTGEKQSLEIYEWAWEYYGIFKKACIACTALYGTLFALVFVSRVALAYSNLTVGQITDDALIISLCVNLGVGVAILFLIRVLLGRAEGIVGEWKKQNGFE